MKEKKRIPEELYLRTWENLDKRGYFYVGGKLTEGPNGTLMQGQMYVEAYVPENIRYDIPLVLIHGAWASGVCWMGTPDGPAVLIGHSQAGPYTWILGDACPDLVRAIIAIEPTGPPFTYGGLEPWLDEEGKPKNWGISQVRLGYEPPAKTAAEIEMEFVPATEEGYASGYLQKEPARKLINLAEIPAAVITGEISFHTPYDYLTAAFLKQAGVPAEYIYLPDLGIYGNGHYMMLEKNSDEIAEMICKWIEGKLN